MTNPWDQRDVHRSSLILLSEELGAHTTLRLEQGRDAASSDTLHKMQQPRAHLILQEVKNRSYQTSQRIRPDTQLLVVGGKHHSVWIRLTDDEVVDIEHLRELLHRQVLFHGSIREVLTGMTTLVALPTIRFLDNESIGLEDTRQRTAGDCRRPNHNVRCSEVVEESRGITVVVRSHHNVENATRAIKGFLKGKVSDVRSHTLAKVLRIVLEDILGSTVAGQDVVDEGCHVTNWNRHESL